MLQYFWSFSIIKAFEARKVKCFSKRRAVNALSNGEMFTLQANFCTKLEKFCCSPLANSKCIWCSSRLACKLSAMFSKAIRMPKQSSIMSSCLSSISIHGHEHGQLEWLEQGLIVPKPFLSITPSEQQIRILGFLLESFNLSSVLAPVFSSAEYYQKKGVKNDALPPHLGVQQFFQVHRLRCSLLLSDVLMLLPTF